MRRSPAQTARTKRQRDGERLIIPTGSRVVKKRCYYLRDALGSVVAVTNDAGTVVRRHGYGDPYGEDVTNDEIVTGAPPNPYRFAGEYLDTETNLYKIGERYYDPALARWYVLHDPRRDGLPVRTSR